MATPSDLQAARRYYAGRKALYQGDVMYRRRGREQATTQPSVPPSWPVTVSNVRYAHGRLHLLLTPHRGEGSFWTSANTRRLRFVEEFPDEPTVPETPDALADR